MNYKSILAIEELFLMRMMLLWAMSSKLLNTYWTFSTHTSVSQTQCISKIFLSPQKMDNYTASVPVGISRTLFMECVNVSVSLSARG